jgi:asparagine synthase (glutamine-hydrolysing)
MGDALAGMIAADVATLLPDDYLVKVDRASMAHGLEVRPPLLDHELLELTARIPSSLKIRGGETKWLMKQAFREVVPAPVLTRPKMGFEMPVDTWLRGPLREVIKTAVMSPKAKVGEFIDQAAARSLYQAHQSGIGRHGSVLWSLLVLASWCNRYLVAPEAVAI